MITVEEARKISDVASLPIIEKETQRFSKMIEKAAKQGFYSVKYECKYPYSLRSMIADRFKENGYRAYADSCYPTIQIIWSKE
jgi:hypothetical protein